MSVHPYELSARRFCRYFKSERGYFRIKTFNCNAFAYGAFIKNRYKRIYRFQAFLRLLRIYLVYIGNVCSYGHLFTVGKMAVYRSDATRKKNRIVFENVSGENLCVIKIRIGNNVKRCFRFERRHYVIYYVDYGDKRQHRRNYYSALEFHITLFCVVHRFRLLYSLISLSGYNQLTDLFLLSHVSCLFA